MVPGCWRKEQLNHLGNPFFVSIVLFSGCIAHVGWACGASLYKDLPGFLPSSLHEDSRFNIVRDGFTCFNAWVSCRCFPSTHSLKCWDLAVLPLDSVGVIPVALPVASLGSGDSPSERNGVVLENEVSRCLSKSQTRPMGLPWDLPIN